MAAGAPEAAQIASAVASLPLDRQLGVVAAACVACRTLAAAASVSDNPQGSTEQRRWYRDWACCVLRRLLELQPSDRLSEAEPGAGAGSGAGAAGGAAWGGGGGTRRLELLPVFLELKWRLAVAALGLAAAVAVDNLSCGTGGCGREALCEE